MIGHLIAPIEAHFSTMVTGDPIPAIVSLLDDFQVYRLSRNWPAMRSLLHQDARLESLAAPGAVLSPDELVSAIATAMGRGLYTVNNWAVTMLDPHTAMADGRVRYRIGVSGLNDEARVWVSSERDDLIWRMRIFHSRQELLACHRDTGIDLGL